MRGKTLKASLIIGGGISSSFRSAMSSAKDGLKAIGDEIVRVEQKQRIMAQHAETFRRMGRDAERAQQQYASFARTADKLRVAQHRIALANDRVEANRNLRTEVGGQLRGATAQFGIVAASAFFPIREAAQFETRMLGVAKQLQGARDAAGNLTPEYFAMARQVQRLGREIPIATNEIADMVAAGLRMGVAKDEVIGFTRTAAMMADSFEMPAGQLADDMGKIAGLFHIPIPRIGELADAINYLDDNAQSKGSEIIDVMRRIGGMAQTLKMPAKEAAALGSTFLSLGSSAEVAGTASNAIMQILGAATAKSKRVRVGLSSIGFDPEDVQASMAKDATGTILRLLDKLNSLPSEQRMVAASRIFGAEYGDDIAKLASGADEYRRQLALVNGEQNKGSMSREFNARLKTVGAQWQLTKNRLTEVAVVIGEALLPAVSDLMNAAAPAVEAFAGWAREHPGFIKGVVGSALALTGLRVVTLGLRMAWLTVASPILKVQQLFARFRAMKAIAEAGGQVDRLGSMLLRVGSIVRTVGAVIAGIGGGPIAAIIGVLTVGALLVRKYWEPIKAFVGGVFQGIREAVGPSMAALGQALAPLKPAWDAVSNAVGRLWNWIGKLLEPVTLSKGEFEQAASAGVKFGRFIGSAISFAVDNITRLIRGIAWIIGKANAFSSAIASVPVVGAPMAWARGAVGLSTPQKPTALPARPSGRVPDALRSAAAPATRGARGAGSPAARTAAKTGGNTYNLNVTQQPGESGEAFARRVMDMLKQQEAAERRGGLDDYY